MKPTNANLSFHTTLPIVFQSVQRKPQRLTSVFKSLSKHKTNFIIVLHFTIVY